MAHLFRKKLSFICDIYISKIAKVIATDIDRLHIFNISSSLGYDKDMIV